MQPVGMTCGGTLKDGGYLQLQLLRFGMRDLKIGQLASYTLITLHHALRDVIVIIVIIIIIIINDIIIITSLRPRLRPEDPP